MRFVSPRLITFDVTGTLLMTNVGKYYAAAGLEHGVIVDSSELAASFKTNFKRVAKQHPNFGKHTGLGSENWWRSLVHSVFRDLDPHIPEEKLSKVATSLIKYYQTRQCWQTYNGTSELLDYLHKQGIILGIISNFDNGLDSILQSLDINRYFSFVLSSYQLGIEKPDPQIFEEALNIFKNKTKNNILPQEALHIGDRIDNDYMGAKNASWNAFLIKRDDEPIDYDMVSKADIFRDLVELKSYMERHLKNSLATNL